MKERKISIFSGIITTILLLFLFFQLLKAPTFILPAWIVAVIIITVLLVGCYLISFVLAIFFKIRFRLTYFISVSITAIVLIYETHSPVLKIIVPQNYSGQVTLVLSNVKENILKVDSNGIGYINERTFLKIYAEPIVVESDGTPINDRCERYNPHSFWTNGEGISSKYNLRVRTLSFQIKSGRNYYPAHFNTDYLDHLDTSKLLRSR
jgi:membrane protein implicated in regulation of membrane protease activity